MHTTWSAGISTRFANATIADVKVMLGTVLRGEVSHTATTNAVRHA